MGISETRESARPPAGTLGTFLGVYTPTALTILGVILYLRLGWVTGQMGTGKTIAIIVLANVITLITTLSFSAIATNIRVGVGGAYYIISRSLGLEFGGAVGLPLFLSQAFSVTLYAFGLAESLGILWPGVPVQPTAFVIVLAVGGLAFRGADLALRAQVPLLGFIALSLVALVFGVVRGPLVEVVGVAPNEPSLGFWAVFAVFFPAVTGIMAGLGLSGDLRDPIRSIPRGAIAATLTGFAVYLVVPLVLARGASPEALRSDPMIWTRIAPLGAILIMPGLWGAIFSSAVGSILGAPRTLLALSTDGLAPRVLGRLSGPKREPIVGLILSTAIALGAVLLGDLNAVAPVVSMFFLTVYGVVNVVAALETLSGDPSWRPQLRVPWPVCLLGGVACAAVMFLISPKAAVAAILLEVILWIFLARREQEAHWGDVRRGVFESLIRWSLVRLARRPMNERNWRPHVLVFVDDTERCLDLIRFGTWFSQERGVVTVCQLVVGDLLKQDIDVRALEASIQKTLAREELVAFGEVNVVGGVVNGITAAAQANGLAGLDSNTVVLGWPRDPVLGVDFMQVAHRLGRVHRSVVIARIPEERVPQRSGRREIHIWWGGLRHNGDLMLLLAHLLSHNQEWRGAAIRVLSVASSELMKSNTENYLSVFLPKVRIRADWEVMLKPKERTVREIIHEKSAGADIVFLGLDPPEEEEQLEAYVKRLGELSDPLRTVFFVKNSSIFEGRLVQTSDGPATTSAEAT